MIATSEVVICAPELRGAILDVAKYPDLELGIDGPAGTGKTYGILYLIHILLLRYPGAKWLVARKHNTDLAGSAMATYRESVLDPREGVSYFGGNKVEPAAYRYPNGSRLIVNGLDKPGKVRSMDFDGIYINEACECTLDDIEFCHMRLARRAKSALPERYQKLIMDFNPDAPTHFLNQRMNEGLTRRLLSRHEDNPFLWDAKTQDWTDAGRRYIDVLNALTGVRLARYRYGIWAVAEGTVYEDSWDRSRNVIEPVAIPHDWPRYLAIDFGYTNPFVCLWCAVDPDGRIIIYRQLYRTKRLVEDHAKDIAIASGWFHFLPKEHKQYAIHPALWADPLPRELICDHDAEDRATLERHLHLMTTPAHKSVSDGLQAVAARLRPAGDGKPRLQIVRGSLIGRDEELAKMKRPLCLEDEMEVYVWAKNTDTAAKEEPVKANDHAEDGCRYLCARFDLQPAGVSYFKDIWR
jgi:phage terminase large subunit